MDCSMTIPKEMLASKRAKEINGFGLLLVGRFLAFCDLVYKPGIVIWEFCHGKGTVSVSDITFQLLATNLISAHYSWICSKSLPHMSRKKNDSD